MNDKFNRMNLGHFPTPIEYLNNISVYLKGPDIYIKRDDCTGLATGVFGSLQGLKSLDKYDF